MKLFWEEIIQLGYLAFANVVEQWINNLHKSMVLWALLCNDHYWDCRGVKIKVMGKQGTVAILSIIMKSLGIIKHGLLSIELHTHFTRLNTARDQKWVVFRQTIFSPGWPPLKKASRTPDEWAQWAQWGDLPLTPVLVHNVPQLRWDGRHMVPFHRIGASVPPAIWLRSQWMGVVNCGGAEPPSPSGGTMEVSAQSRPVAFTSGLEEIAAALSQT